jgi:hypothetical protein
MTQEKKDNVFGIGHNTNEYSKEQYAKVVNSLHRVLKFSRQELNKVERFLDQAFTKYPFSNSNQPKLKEFEVHESRQTGRDTARKYRLVTDKHIADIETKAKADGIELELLIKEKELEGSDE